MNDTTWRVQAELPAITAISDDHPWVNLRGVYSDRESADVALLAARKGYDWPVRLVKHVELGGGATEEQHVELEEMFQELRKLQKACIIIDNGYKRCLICQHYSPSLADDVRHESGCPLYEAEEAR